MRRRLISLLAMSLMVAGFTAPTRANASLWQRCIALFQLASRPQPVFDFGRAPPEDVLLFFSTLEWKYQPKYLTYGQAYRGVHVGEARFAAPDGSVLTLQYVSTKNGRVMLRVGNSPPPSAAAEFATKLLNVKDPDWRFGAMIGSDVIYHVGVNQPNVADEAIRVARFGQHIADQLKDWTPLHQPKNAEAVFFRSSPQPATPEGKEFNPYTPPKS